MPLIEALSAFAAADLVLIAAVALIATLFLGAGIGDKRGK
jgi:hypothetical protein